MYDNYCSFEIGTGGHYPAIEGASFKLMKELKQAQKEVSGCPINYKAKTIMPEATFRRTCLAFQKKAGLIVKSETDRHSDIVGGFFRSKNRSLCSQCRTGKSVRGNRRICQLPTNVSLDDTMVQKPKKLIKRKISN